MADEGSKLGPYTLVESIGQGGFATVWLAHDEEGNTVAVKRFSADHGKAVDKEKAANERACLERFDHPNVLALLDAVEDEAGVDALVLEYCEEGDLIKKMKRVLDGSPENELSAYQIWRQIVEGIGHMHERGVAHLDLKPQNVLLASASEDTIKLCDFSHSFVASSAAALVPASQVGAGKYMAPEVSSGRPYDGYAGACLWSSNPGRERRRPPATHTRLGATTGQPTCGRAASSCTRCSRGRCPLRMRRRLRLRSGGRSPRPHPPPRSTRAPPAPPARPAPTDAADAADA